MTDYKKFHDKQVALGTQDDPINIHIDTLRDLDSPDEGLFAITETTPPAQRLTTTHIGEKAARQLIKEQKEIRWPAVSNKPVVKSIDVYLVIGRDGHVKQAWSYGQVEQPVKDTVLEAIRQWTFKPQTVNGVPAQISTKLVIPIALEVQGDAARQPAAKRAFERARAAGGIRLEGAQAFHMKASFHTEDGKVKGTYEETWMAPKRWRRDVKLNEKTVTEIRTEEAFYRVFPGQFAPRVPDDILEIMSFGLPGDSGADVHEADWKVVKAKLGGVPVLRLSHGYVNPQEKPDPTTVEFYIEEKTGFVRGRYHYSNFTIFNDLQPFGGKSVARKLASFGGDFSRMDLAIESLEPASNVPDEIFKLAGVKPVFTSDDENEHRFTLERPIHTVKSNLSGWHGKAECDLSLDEHGHVREVDVKGVTDESVISAIRSALMNWEYAPPTFNGRPVVGLAHVVVQ